MPFECAAERPSQSQEHLSARVQETQVEASTTDSGPRVGGGGLRPGAPAHRPVDELEVDREGEDASARPPMAFMALLLGAPRFSCRCKGEDKWGLSTTKWRFKLRAVRALHFQLVPRLFPKTRRGRNFEQGERYIASREPR